MRNCAVRCPVPDLTALVFRGTSQTYETALMRTLFEYVRRGLMVDALDLCRRVRQPWRAAAMRGALFYRDPLLGTLQLLR